MSNDPEKRDLFLDPERDKLKVEQQIIERIEQLLPEADHDEVVTAVEVEYEELISVARVNIS
jgi:hypothetical protein